MRHGLDRGVMLGIALLALMMVGVGVTSFVNTRDVRSDAAAATRSHEVIEAVAAVRAETRRVQADQRAYLVTGFPDWVPPYRESAARLRTAATALTAQTADDPEQHPRARAAAAEIELGLASLDRVLQLRGGPDGLAAVVALSRERGRASFVDPLLQTLDAMDAAERERLARREADTRAAFDRTVLYAAAGAALGLVALGLFVAMLRRTALARQRDAGRLAEQRELLDATLSSIGDGVIATDAAGNVTFLNGVAQTLTGWAQADAFGRPLAEVFRIVNESTRRPVENPAVRALEQGVIVGLANHTVLIARDGAERPIDDSAAPIRAHGRVGGAVLVFRDITERRAAETALQESEGRHRVLAELAEATRPLTDPAAIMATAARLLAEHLGTDRCAYAEVEDEAVYVITGDHTRGVPSIVGRWPVGAFGAEHSRTMRANEPYVVDDADTDPRITPADLPAYRATDIRAVVCVPLHKTGRFTAAMAVHQRTPRHWAPDEVGLVTAVVGRCWEALERARVDRALRASEQRFRSVFEAMQEGFCLVEPVFDTAGSPVDYRYLLANPALERHTGLAGVVGKTARQVMPAHEQVWVEGYARVAVTGEPFRREGWVEDLGRWYEVSATRVGDPDLRQVGVVFTDVSDRWRAAEAVRANERQLADVFRHAPSFMAVLRGPGHVFERVNDRYSQLVGGRAVVGRPVAEALPEVVPQGFVALLDRVYRTGEPHIGTGTRVLLAPGGGRPSEERYLDFVYQPLRDAGGAVTGILVQGIDQTDRRRAEAEVRERDERLQVFLDTATDYAVVISDPRGRVVEWLGGAEAITGYPPAEAVGRGADLLFTPEDRAAGAPGREMASAARDGQAEDKRWHQRKDGDQFYADGVMVALRGEGGGLRGFGKVFRDATARKRADDAVRFLADAGALLAELVDYESTLRRIANLAVTGFADWCVVDILEADGVRRRLAVSHAEPDDVTSARAADAAIPPGAVEGGVPHVLRTGEPEVVPDLDALDPATAPQGAERIARLHAWGVRSYLCIPLVSRGRVIGGMTFLGQSTRRRFGPDELRVAQDLAARVAAAIENAQLYRDLQEQHRRKDEFLATLAHELRNPLAPVRNGLQILRMILPTDERAGRALEMMDRQLGHMVHLVDDLMDVARVSSGKVVLRLERVELRTVVEAAVEATHQAAEAGGHELVVELPDEPLAFHADRTRLVQVLSNLISNAAKYTPHGGRVAVTAARGGGHAVVRVVDTGVGIAPDMLPKVFEMFAQVGTSLERSQGGLGIGLTLVKRLVEMHGGAVSAESPGPGKGSTFTVRLPLAPGAPQPAESAPSGGVTGRRLAVLVVDDNVDAAESMSVLLGLQGLEVRTAHDGPEALRVLGTYRPDVVFLDIGLPGMTGYEVARRIRESGAHRGVTLAALTGWGQEEDRRRSQAAGFDHHLTKPVDPADLQRVLSGVAALGVDQIP
ncbi:PAS domain S-box protein [bacterium]|nr:PAS domain S-box protein [bacterium]